MTLLRAILFDILGPILVLIALGAVLRRKFALDLATLSKLNIYLFVPAFIFDVVSRSTLSWGAMGGVMVVTTLNVLLLGGVVWAIGVALRVNRRTLAAIALAVMFYNSGNYGLPLAALAFPTPAIPTAATSAVRDGAAVQAFVVFAMNLLTFTVGLAIAAGAGSGDSSDEWKSALKTYLRLPMFPAVVAALLARWWIDPEQGRELPVVIAKSARYLSDGLVPIALVTLGAQLAHNPRWPRWRPVSLVLVLRLLLGPLLMAGLLYALHRLGFPPLDLWHHAPSSPLPWPAASLVLTAGVPTAVNTLLLVLEVGGDADLTADCVFWTTVASCLTIPAWLLLLQTAPHWLSP